jgi:hydrogenase expression/formation protein HypE
MKPSSGFDLQCPIPINELPQILLSHGGGGRLMHQLIQKMFVKSFGEETLQVVHDSAVINLDKTKIAFTTDSYVVNPLFFPGGDIGSLAINGTVNDLAMSGARPLYISLGFILEEGLEMESLWRITQSIKEAADKANVQVITGDTKVVDRGKGDGIFINTSGIGVIEHDIVISPNSIKIGDSILVNGDLGRHGMAIMAVREGLEFETTIESDSAPLCGCVQELLAQDIEIHCMRDLTRGGLASASNEIAEASGLKLTLDEIRIPVCEEVKGACEILGLDPLYVANEGRFILFVPADYVEKALEVLRNQCGCEMACVIGEVASNSEGIVELNSVLGPARILDMLSGEQLPRIC